MKKGEQELDEKKVNKKRFLKGRIRIIAGIVLVILGISAIAAAILVPRMNQGKNDKAIEEIKSGKYAEQAVEATPEAVTTDESVEVSTEPVVEEPSERDVKMAQILGDDTRIGIVEIEKIDVLYAIAEGTEDAQINRAIGHLTESAGIGEKGNCVIVGHRGGFFGTFFERIPELENGDEVVLTDLNGREYHYVVYDKKVVDPADWSVTKDLEDKHTLTMITCQDDTRKRVAVAAVLYTP